MTCDRESPFNLKIQLRYGIVLVYNETSDVTRRFKALDYLRYLLNSY